MELLVLDNSDFDKLLSDSSEPENPNATEQDVRDQALQHATDALNVITNVMHNTELHPTTRMQAAMEILNRGLGRPTQSINTTVKEPVRRPDLSKFTDEELELWQQLLNKLSPHK
jgi:hypothetical protein